MAGSPRPQSITWPAPSSPAGHVVPGLTVEPDGRGRSWWWPLPTASQRPLVAALVRTRRWRGSGAWPTGCRAVDAIVRDRAGAGGASSSSPGAGGRPVLAEPGCGPSSPPTRSCRRRSTRRRPPRSRRRAGVGGVRRGGRRPGAAVPAGARPGGGGRWPGRAARAGPGRDPASSSRSPTCGPDTPRSPTASSRRSSPGWPAWPASRRSWPACSTRPAPAGITVDGGALVRLLRERAPVLEDAGIAVLLPSWWVAPVRGRAAGQGPAQRVVARGTAAGSGMDAIVQFTLGGGPRRAAPDQARPRGARSGRPTPSSRSSRARPVGRHRRRAGACGLGMPRPRSGHGRDLVRAALGLDHLLRRPARPRRSGDAGAGASPEITSTRAGVGWLASLLDDAVARDRRAAAHARGFAGDVAALPGAGRRVAGVPRSAGPGRLPGRRHGARQDRPAHRLAARRARRAADARDLPGLGARQLGARAGPVRTGAAGARAPRPRPPRRHDVPLRRPGGRRTTSCSPPTRWSPATSSTSPRWRGAGSCSTRPSR